MSVIGMKNGAARTRLLACVSAFCLMSGQVFAASVTVTNGQTDTTLDQISGTDAVVVNVGGTMQAPTTSSAIIQWSGAATGPGVSIENDGSILGATNLSSTNSALIQGNGASSTGILTITNTGLMSNKGGDIILGGSLPSTASVVINNSGTITNSATTVNTTFMNLQTHNMDAVSLGGQIGAAISENPTSSAANMTITNSGTINGGINLGTGTNVVNLTTASVLTGGIAGSASGNNTVNLSGSGNGIAYGASEFGSNPVSPVYNVPSQKTFDGWDNIQTLNVNSGNWSLVGGGYYNNLNITSGAIFNVCADGPDTACGSAYDGSHSPNVTISGSGIGGTVAFGGVGQITDGGIGPLNETNGTLAIANNGQVNIFVNSNDTGIFYDPTLSPQVMQITGTGSLVINGAGSLYLAPTSSIIQASLELSNGATYIDAGAITAAVTVDSGARLDIGSGGHLVNVDNNAPDNGTTGAVTGAITDNGTLQFDLANAYTYSGVLSGNGLLIQAGGGTTTLSGMSNTFTGSVHVEAGTLKTAIPLKLVGANSITVDTGATVLSGATTSAAIQWFGAATGSGVSITNNGSILGATNVMTSNSALVQGNTTNSTGTLTITNAGLISNQGGVISLGASLPSTANVVVNNSGTITDSQTTVNQALMNLMTHMSNSVALAGEIGPGISENPTSSAANVTITNSGTINGGITLGTGTNVVNITTGSVLTGGIAGSALGNNTVNLSGSGNGIAFGASEFGSNPVSSIYNLAAQKTFYGWDNIQTLNVNSGTWSLVGGGYYNNLNIAANAVFNVCADGPDTACGSAYNGSNSPNLTISGSGIGGPIPFGGSGQITDGGTGPLNETNGTLAIANNGQVNIFVNSNDNGIFYDPTLSPQVLQITGTGSLVFNGAGTLYLAPTSSITQTSLELSNGANYVIAGTLTAAVTVDSGSTLSIGSGGNLLNVNNNAPDDGSTGSVTGNITDNGTVNLKRFNGSFAGNITGTGAVAVNSQFALTGSLTYSGGTTVNSGGGLLVGTNAAAPSGLTAFTQGTVVNNGGIELHALGNVTMSGNISGTGDMSYDVPGAPIITITGTHSYTGETEFDPDTSAGVLQIGNGGTAGSLSTSEADIFGTLAFDRSDTYTFAGKIVDEDSEEIANVAQTGSGTTILSNTGNSFTGNVTVSSGTLKTATSFKLSGTNNITVAAGATLAENGSTTPILFTGAPTTSTLTNNGTISGTTGPSVVGVSSVTGGNINIVNTGTITNTGAGFGVISLSNLLPSGTNVTINNSGTISTTGMAGVMAVNPLTNAPQVFTFLPVAIVSGGAASTTFTNSGTIRGSVLLGSGTNVINLVTGETITGRINGLASSNNTMNLSGSGSGFVYGRSEATYTNPPYSAPVVNSVFNFYGYDNIQNLNVNSGTWTLVGGGYYNTVSVAAGATFNVCDAAVLATCAAGYNTALGTPTDGGIGPLNETSSGTFNIAINGTLVHNSPDKTIYYDATTGKGAITGTGTLEEKGGGTAYFGPNDDLTKFAGMVVVDSGNNFGLGTTLAGNVTVNAGGTLQIGSGGTLTSSNNLQVDAGTSGDVLGAVIDNGTLIFDRTDDFNFSANLSGNGSIIKMNSDTVTLTGVYTYAGTTTIQGGKVNVLGALSANSTLNLASGTVNLGGTTQTIGGLSNGTGSTTSNAVINLGGGTLVIDQSSGSSAFSGTITGAGTIIFAGTSTTTLVLNGTSNFGGTVDVNGGTIQIGSSSAPGASFTGSVAVGSNGSLAVGDANSSNAVLNGNVTVASGGTVSGHGTINGSVTNLGTTAPGGSIGTLTVAGDFTFAAGSVLAQDVAANGTADLLKVTGAATIASNVTLQVQPADALTSFARVTNYTIITAGNGLSGTFGSVTSTLAGLDPIVSYSGSAVNVALVRTDISLGTLGANTSQANVGTAISNGSGSALFAAVAPQSDAVVRQALAQQDGEIHTTTLTAILEDDQLMSGAILDRGMADGVAVWGSMDGGRTHFGAGANNVAARDDRQSFMAGADMPVWDVVRAGLVLGVSSDQVYLSGQAANAGVSSLMVGGYLKAAQGPIRVTAGLDVTWHRIGTQRFEQFASVNESETAHYHDNSVNLFGEAAYRFDLDNGVYAEPLVDLDWSRLSSEAFAENGGIFALHKTFGTSREVSFVTLGGRLGEEIAIGGGLLKPHLLAGYEIARGDLTGVSNYALSNGAEFNAVGAPVAGGMFRTEAGLGLALGAAFDVDLSYTGRFADHVQTNDVDLRLGYHF